MIYWAFFAAQNIISPYKPPDGYRRSTFTMLTTFIKPHTLYTANRAKITKIFIYHCFRFPPSWNFRDSPESPCEQKCVVLQIYGALVSIFCDKLITFNYRSLYTKLGDLKNAT